MDKLQEELNKLGDPNYSIRMALKATLEEMKALALGTKGDTGDTPVRGVDYWTEEDVEELINFVQARIRVPEDGKPGKNGKNGKNGETPVKGVDYYTPKEREELIAKIQKSIRVPNDGVSPDPEKVAESAIAKIMKGGEIVTVKQLTEFLKRGGFRGGGGGPGAGAPGTVVWTTVTATSATMAGGGGYVANNASLVTLALPTVAPLNSIIEVVGLGNGGWEITQPAGVYVNYGNDTTTVGVGGSLASVNKNDAIKLICTVENVGWSVLSSVGNITVV